MGTNDLQVLSAGPLSVPNAVRMDGFKLEGGELFKEGFRNLLKQE